MRKFQCLLFVLKRSYSCCYIICMTVPLKAEKLWFQDILFRFFTMKNKVRSIHYWTLYYTLFTKRVIKIWIIENSSPVPTTASSNQCFIVGKTAVKKWIVIKTPWKNNEWKLSCDDKQKREEIRKEIIVEEKRRKEKL